MIRPHQCPICESEFEPNAENSESLFPFCSARCRNIDLSRWFGDRYKVVEQLDPQTAEMMQYDPNIEVEKEAE
jgi:endogenous inhibitor of DNA gyrase (YacG/DUF329 family)